MDFIPNPLIIPAGLIIGVLVAAPVGPVNVLCIQRAIERGFWGGIAAGLGAVLGDGLIALFASLGVGAISGAVKYHRFAIQIVGGLALFAFGLKLYFATPRFETVTSDSVQPETLRDFVWDIPQTFFLTITNPGAVLGLFAIFGGVSSFVEVTSYVEALLMVAAIMGGSIAWWVMLSNLISKYRHHIDIEKLGLINRVGGLLLMLFGAVLVVGAISKWD
ncbi:MAG: LysE family translocator [Alphaproteobacteria bacterium]|nr:LysE family translocator [Alphaproteobacteria bacterium]